MARAASENGVVTDPLPDNTGLLQLSSTMCRSEPILPHIEREFADARQLADAMPWLHHTRFNIARPAERSHSVLPKPCASPRGGGQGCAAADCD